MSMEGKFKKKVLNLYPYCQWCACYITEESATVDHVIPKSKGGLNQVSNYVLSCRRCNEEKDNKIVQRKPYGPQWRSGFTLDWKNIMLCIKESRLTPFTYLAIVNQCSIKRLRSRGYTCINMENCYVRF